MAGEAAVAMNDEMLVQWPRLLVTTKICLRDGCSCTSEPSLRKGDGSTTITAGATMGLAQPHQA